VSEPLIPIVVGDTPERLADLLGVYLSYRRIYRKVLECGPGVSEALATVLPEASPKYDSYAQGASLGVLTGIEVLPVDGMGPGQWRIREHSACETHLDPPRVSHEGCPVRDEGQLK
jgi:hypothetical protein